MNKSAVISECGKYRYSLSRVWNEKLPQVLWIMLNPSTGDSNHDDPTIRRLYTFTDRMGAGGLTIVNLFAFRTSSPKELKQAEYAIGIENDTYIFKEIAKAQFIMCAWGNHGGFKHRDLDIVGYLSYYNYSAYCLGYTKTGHPTHPLFIKSDTSLIKFV